jgi:hypothetical protein
MIGSFQGHLHLFKQEPLFDERRDLSSNVTENTDMCGCRFQYYSKHYATKQ